jgi:hypothetical protein
MMIVFAFWVRQAHQMWLWANHVVALIVCGDGDPEMWYYRPF